MGVYAAEELMTTAAYLRSVYGNRMPERGEEDTWKLSEIEMYHKSPLFGISNYFRIPNKASELVPLRPFAGQAILDLCIETQRRAGLPQRVVGFKSRQVGWSTWMLGRSLHRVSSSPNKRAMFLVPDEDVANVMATRLGAMLNNLPRFMQPMRRIQNLKHVVFDNPNPKDRMDNPGLNSELQITVPSPMRGIPPQMLTLSEYSHMPPEIQLIVTSSIIPAMPLTEHSLIVIDTTPNGFDDFYEPLVRTAMEANPKWIKRLEDSPRAYTAEEILSGAIGTPENLYSETAWLLAFERWDWHEEYAVRCKEFPRGQVKRPPPNRWKEFLADIGRNPKYGGEEENDLAGRYGVKPEQLYWRRQNINQYEMPTAEMKLATFHQEFAMSIEGGFIELSKTPFDRESIEALLRQQRDPIATGLFDRGENDIIGIRHSLATNKQEWRIYAPPERGEKYSIGVDTNSAYESEDSDSSCAVVMRYRDRKVVAVYMAKVPEFIMRAQLFLAYKWYYDAYTAVEISGGMGYELMRSLIRMGVHNYYMWKRLDAESPEPSKYPGWQTDRITRPIMDSTFIEHVCWRDEGNKPAPKIIIPDRELLKQIQGIRRGDSGSLKQAHGKDDGFDAICIALCLFDDPYGGFHKAKVAQPVEQQEEFERLFRASVGGNSNRNRPSLASL